MPATRARTTSVSHSEFRRRATNVPRATPRGTAMSSAPPARRGLTRSPGAITSITGVLANRNERPKSPRTMPATYVPNWRHSGRSSPYSARSRASSATSPERSLRSVMIGSPGTNWLATNVRTTAASRTGRRPSARRSAYDLTRALSRGRRRSELSGCLRSRSDVGSPPAGPPGGARRHGRPGARLAHAPQLSVTVLNGRNRKGVRRTPWTFGFRSAICIRTTSGHVPQSVSSTCSAVW